MPYTTGKSSVTADFSQEDELSDAELFPSSIELDPLLLPIGVRYVIDLMPIKVNECIVLPSAPSYYRDSDKPYRRRKCRDCSGCRLEKPSKPEQNKKVQEQERIASIRPKKTPYTTGKSSVTADFSQEDELSDAELFPSSIELDPLLLPTGVRYVIDLMPIKVNECIVLPSAPSYYRDSDKPYSRRKCRGEKPSKPKPKIDVQEPKKESRRTRKNKKKILKKVLEQEKIASRPKKTV